MVTLLSDEQDELLVPMSELHSLIEAHIPGAELVQRQLREAQVVSLAMADPASWPKIVLTRTKEYGLIILDGYHRQEAGKRRRISEIRATIRAFDTVNEVIEAAFEANLHHGLPTADKTRSDYAYWLFVTYPDLKQNEIARKVGIKPSTVNTAIKKRVREAEAAEKKRQQLESPFWSKQATQEEAIREARDKEIAQAIHAYVKQSKRLYQQLRRLDDDGERYWALEKAINEGDKLTLARTCQYIERYLKDSLPENLAKTLKPTAARTRQTKASTSKGTEATPPEKEQ